MQSTKEPAAHEEARSGSTVLLTGPRRFSDKLLALASPPKQRVRLHWDLRGTAPYIGAVWYLLIVWPFHLYLAYNCFTKLQSQSEDHIVIAVQVLLVFSLVAMLFFSVSLFLKLDCQLKPPMDGTPACFLQKYPAVKHLQALKSQQYLLHGLAALLLMISISLLQLGSPGQQQSILAGEAGMTNATRVEPVRNHSKSRHEFLLPMLPQDVSVSSILLCLNVLSPMFLHAMAESDPIWQRERLWGASFSAVLVLASMKSLSLSLTFDALYVKAALAPYRPTIFQSRVWIPPLYALSLLSLFMFCISLKVYVDLSCPELGSSPAGLKLRRKARPCPSPLALLLTTLVQIASEVPFLVELYLIFCENINVYFLMLWAFNLGFCLLCCAVCLGVFLLQKYRISRCRAKKERTASGLCLAHSFIYQTSKLGSSSRC
ncbi:hypothetical protein NDU88_004740 [Pleurodeles waltl]|uniref:Uncharacterized protein n=1 Tax=Pleurodeles waltl TaxID=8319 RepID=A0AAV7PGK8_PLEWA|nr:hypothetical protein NDU88_004740 [Pleurodeles waltl]